VGETAWVTRWWTRWRALPRPCPRPRLALASRLSRLAPLPRPAPYLSLAVTSMAGVLDCAHDGGLDAGVRGRRGRLLRASPTLVGLQSVCLSGYTRSCSKYAT
jgi:hypothetical protein